jgi:hypothetical protein
MAIPKRKRYVVFVESNGETKSAIIIADDLVGMYREIYRLFGYLLKDVNGRDIGKLTYEEFDLA